MKDPDLKIPIILSMVFPQEWLDAKMDNDTKGRTNREFQTQVQASLYFNHEVNLQLFIPGLP